jgi:aryl-alcohol dehydrogenase-like predicted oxidoreductase
MRIKNLGTQGIMASELGLGCMGMSDFYEGRNDEESLKTLDRAIELGVTFWDTSDMYGPYKNEELLSKALAGRRDKVTLATKFGILRDPSNSSFRGVNGKPEYVHASCEGSLKRLKIDTIDLFYLHRMDPNTPIEDTVGAMAELVKEGKIRGIGLSEVSEESLRKANKVHPVSALQTEYSLWTRDPEDGILEACRELGIAFVAYSPLGRGFLTGNIKGPNDLKAGDARINHPRFQFENLQKNLRLVNEIKRLANEKGCTPPQLALAWVMEQGDFIFPIPGTKRIKYLEENAGALDVKLTEDEVLKISELFPKNIAAGSRYPESAMRTINQ